MSSSKKPEILAYVAETDLSAHQYKIVKKGTNDNQVVICGAGERGCGVLMNAPAAGETAEVAVFGGALVKVSSNVTKDASCASGALGIGVNAGAAVWSIGTFENSGVSGDVVAIFIDRHNSPA